MSKKKAQIQMQFNWVFVLIAGGLILTFFFFMAMKQKDSSTVAISATVKDNVVAIFEGAKVSSGTSTLVKTSDIEIKFNCEASGYSTYEVQGLSTQVPADAIFAPNILSGRDLITWAYSWDVPFKIMNFLFIANPRTRFVIVGDQLDDLVMFINATFPKEYFVSYYESFDLGEIQNLNDDITKFIFVNQGPTSDNIFDIHESFQGRGNKATVLHVQGNFESGSVGFYENHKLPASFNVRKDSSYVGAAGLFGAMFSDTKEYFDCNMNKALRRFNYINEIYLERTRNMQIYYRDIAQDASCSSHFAGAVSNFNALNQTSYCAVFSKSSCSTPDVESSLSAISAESALLSQANYNAKRFSCDHIY
jgi:hypothetical protein